MKLEEVTGKVQSHCLESVYIEAMNGSRSLDVLADRILKHKAAKKGVVYCKGNPAQAEFTPDAMSPKSSFSPPDHPPPILDHDQVFHLARTGYLLLESSPNLHACLQDLLQLIRELFKQPTSFKETQFPSAQGTELGYYLVENEKEYLTFRHQYSGDFAKALSLAASRFWSVAASFLYRILCDLSIALDIPLPVWDPLLDGCLTMPASRSESTPSLLRLFDYLPNTGAAEMHTDTGFLTLCIGTAPGLQAKIPDAEWLDVGTQPTILVGKTLQWLSNGRVQAGLHRVVPNMAGRQSVVLALRPSLRHPKLDLTPFGEPSVVDVVDVWNGIRGSVFNVNAQTKIREEQKRLLKAKQGIEQGFG
ncbi:MAG: hypothetical protein Q9169_002627 [Polycauliona sp. 2 TL-2023]